MLGSLSVMIASVYLWAKVAHLLCVVGWIATVFVLSAAIRIAADDVELSSVRERFVAFGLGAYRLGHHLFGWAVIFGLVLWLYVGVGGGWLHVKLVVVTLFIVHFTWGGRRLKAAKRKGVYPSRRFAFWFAWAPVALLFVVVWLVLGKPF